MEVSQASYQIIADLLEARTGQHLTESRRWRVATALSGVFREHGISNVDQLVCLLDLPMRSPGKPDLSQQVVEALLNNETYFFRDKPTFDQLPENILPDLASRREDTRRISIWCAGCSTGQEVYSIAMQILDSPERWDGWTIDILGTDVSHRAINAARNGVYSQFEVQRGLGVAQMLRHFEETSQGWQVSENTRSISRFQQHSILLEPPARHRFDLILCRNVLLYFDQPTRARAFSRLSSALMPDGFLMLGAGETVVGQTDAFTPVARRASIYENSHRAIRRPAMAIG
ncbi:protein-glutamate O-methyltransferase CheR [Erythrobacter insulae]|uniref:protein-glutamate O-methyltransferase n=1 Tax=Erythrobacter insulae TaxID=2584124 RepID=A0A547P9S0_9SPHN|nr:protein-glutamate O-methyltransferase CheR [Erythrobacter insulae]TRD10870.1 protein-glutamate O-methyltransferase CheR [Erythrobacter insulae]